MEKPKKCCRREVSILTVIRLSATMLSVDGKIFNVAESFNVVDVGALCLLKIYGRFIRGRIDVWLDR